MGRKTLKKKVFLPKIDQEKYLRGTHSFTHLMDHPNYLHNNYNNYNNNNNNNFVHRG